MVNLSERTVGSRESCDVGYGKCGSSMFNNWSEYASYIRVRRFCVTKIFHSRETINQFRGKLPTGQFSGRAAEGKRVKRVKVALRRKKIRDIWPAREWSHLTTYLPFLRLMNSNPFDISPRLNTVPGRRLIFQAAVFRHVFPPSYLRARPRAHYTRYRPTHPFFNLFP